MVIPEELKKVVCCLKCEKVDAEYITKDIENRRPGSVIPSRSTVVVCKKCSQQVTSYAETEPRTVIMGSLILAVVLCIIENSFQYFFKGTQFPALLGHDFVIFLICLGITSVGLSEHKQVKKLLENHLKHERRTDIKVEEDLFGTLPKKEETETKQEQTPLDPAPSPVFKFIIWILVILFVCLAVLVIWTEM